MKYKLAIFGFFLAALISFSDIGNYFFFHNEKASLHCTRFSFIDIIHPGKPETTACSYDHQPLYSLILKTVKYFHPLTPFAARVPSAFFFSLSAFVFSLWMSFLGVTRLLNIAGIVLFCTTPFLLYESMQARLYGLLLLTSITVFYLGGLYRKGHLKFRWLFLVHMIGYFNFFLFYPITFVQFISLQWPNIKMRSKEILGLLGITVLVILKLPYIYEWRFLKRVGNEHWWPSSQALKEFLVIPFFQAESSLWFLAVSAVFLCLCVYSFYKTRRFGREKIDYFLLVVYPIVFFLIGHFVFELHELVTRYFIYIWPVLLVSLVSYLSNLNMKDKSRRLTLCLLFFYSVMSFSYYKMRPFSMQGHASPHANKNISDYTFELAKKNKLDHFHMVSNELYLFDVFVRPGLEVSIPNSMLLTVNEEAVLEMYMYYMQHPDQIKSFDEVAKTQFPKLLEFYNVSEPLFINNNGWPYLEIRKLTLKNQ